MKEQGQSVGPDMEGGNRENDLKRTAYPEKCGAVEPCPPVPPDSAVLEELRRLGAELRATRRDLPEAMDTVVHQILAPPLQSLTLMLSGLEGRLEGLEEAVIGQDKRQADVLQTNVNALALRLDGVQKRLDLMEKGIHELLGALVRQNDAETQMFVEALNGRFNGLLSVLERVEGRVQNLEEQTPATPPDPPTTHHSTPVSPTSIPSIPPPVAAPPVPPPSAGPPMDTPTVGESRQAWWNRRNAVQSAGGETLADKETVLDASYRNLIHSVLGRGADDGNPDVMPTHIDQKKKA